MTDIILDRSTLEKVASCPHSSQISRAFDAVRAKARGDKLFDHEVKLIESLDTELVRQLWAYAGRGNESLIQKTGILIHDLVDEAFKACKDDPDLIPDYFATQLPKLRPDIQPHAIRAGRYVADKLADLHVKTIGTEVQLSAQILPATSSRGKVLITSCLDYLGQSKDAIHVWDWKTGYKRRTNTEAYDSFQAQFIALLLYMNYPSLETVHFWYQETRWGSVAYARFDRNQEHPRLPHLSTYEAIKERVMSAVKLFLQGCNEAWPEESKCLYCEAIHWCDLLHMDAVELADNPRKYVDSLVVDMASVKKRKAVLTKYIKAHGAVAGTEVVYDRKMPAERFTAEFKKLTDAEDEPEPEEDE